MTPLRHSHLLAVVALVAAGCSKAEPEETAPTVADYQASHRRMVDELNRVRMQTPGTNRYLGTRRLEHFQGELKRSGAARDDLDRFRLLVEVVDCEQILGREEEALAHLREARETLERYKADPVAPEDERGDRQPLEQLEENRFLLRYGVAWLRRGETLNCCDRWTPDSCILPIRGEGVHELREPSEKASELFLTVLEQTNAEGPLHRSALWLLNIAAMTLGEHPDGVPAAFRIAPEAFDSDAEFPRFENRAPAMGLDTMSLSGGATADDFDGDGDLDLFVTSWDTSGIARYFRNDGDGTFSERTGEAGLDGIYGGLNCLQADYDNDGDLDILILRGAWLRVQGRHPNSLLQNQGDASFLDVTFAAGLGDSHWPTQTAAWADYDLDGDLDLYVGNEHSDYLGAPSQLFRNDGDGGFTDVAEAAGVTNDRYAKGVAWGDYDNDRFPDLFVSNLQNDNRLYHNNGDGTFTDVAQASGVRKPRRSFPAWFWDFNQDGDLDLFVASYSATIPHVAMAYMGTPGTVGMMRLYQGDGRGGFTNVTLDVNLWRPAAPMGSNFGDLNGDGLPDFYLGTGYPDYQELMPNQLYLNQGGERFADITTAAGVGHLQKGHAVVFADFDADGDVDLFQQMGGAYPGDPYKDALYENPGFGNAFLSVELRGDRSNRFGVGSQIRVFVSGPDGARTFYRTVSSGGSFGANPLRQTIGLGDADRIQRLEVFWPASDRTDVYSDVPIDAHIRVTEGSSSYETLERPASTLGG